MIELEIYAAGIRHADKILALGHELETVPGLRYKVDTNHDVVYLEFDGPTVTVEQLRAMFNKIGVTAQIVGAVPPEMSPKSKTTRLRVG